MSAVVFPDIVAVLLDRLRADVPSLTFVHEIPVPRPVTFVRIFRTGGPRLNLVVDGAQITVESWAPTVPLASANAQLVRAHLNALPEQRTVTPNIYRVDEMAGPAELPDLSSGSHRFTWSAIVAIRGGAGDTVASH